MKTTKTIKVPVIICDYCKKEITYKAHDVDGKKDYHPSCADEMEEKRRKV